VGRTPIALAWAALLGFAATRPNRAPGGEGAWPLALVDPAVGVAIRTRRDGFLWLRPAAFIDIPAECWAYGVAQALDRTQALVHPWKRLHPRGRVRRLRMDFVGWPVLDLLTEIAEYFRTHPSFDQALRADRTKLVIRERKGFLLRVASESPSDLFSFFRRYAHRLQVGYLNGW